MEKRNAFTKILAIVGTVLVWFPILAPVLLSLTLFIGRGRFLLDYLMPAELFPFALAGSLSLLWAGLRARSHWKLIAWGLGIAVALLIGSQALAVVTGLASGATEPTGVWWILVLAALAAFVVALIAIAVGGILLLRDLFKPAQLPTPTG